MPNKNRKGCQTNDLSTRVLSNYGSAENKETKKLSNQITIFAIPLKVLLLFPLTFLRLIYCIDQQDFELVFLFIFVDLRKSLPDRFLASHHFEYSELLLFLLRQEL